VSGSLAGTGGVAVDPRLKGAHWMEAFQERGGQLSSGYQDESALAYFAHSPHYDAVVVAVGGGATSPLGEVFDHDPGRAAQIQGPRGTARTRTLAQAYLHGLAPGETDIEVVSTPDGEVMVAPVLAYAGLDHAGRPTVDPGASSLQVFGTPGGPLDCGASPRPDNVYAAILQVLDSCAPELAERVRAGEADMDSVLATTVAPRVRRPVAHFDGGFAAGVGDALTSVDPASAQVGGAAPRSAVAL